MIPFIVDDSVLYLNDYEPNTCVIFGVMDYEFIIEYFEKDEDVFRFAFDED